MALCDQIEVDKYMSKADVLKNQFSLIHTLYGMSFKRFGDNIYKVDCDNNADAVKMNSIYVCDQIKSNPDDNNLCKDMKRCHDHRGNSYCVEKNDKCKRLAYLGKKKCPHGSIKHYGTCLNKADRLYRAINNEPLPFNQMIWRGKKLINPIACKSAGLEKYSASSCQKGQLYIGDTPLPKSALDIFGDSADSQAEKNQIAKDIEEKRKREKCDREDHCKAKAGYAYLDKPKGEIEPLAQTSEGQIGMKETQPLSSMSNVEEDDDVDAITF